MISAGLYFDSGTFNANSVACISMAEPSSARGSASVGCLLAGALKDETIELRDDFPVRKSKFDLYVNAPGPNECSVQLVYVVCGHDELTVIFRRNTVKGIQEPREADFAFSCFRFVFAIGIFGARTSRMRRINSVNVLQKYDAFIWELSEQILQRLVGHARNAEDIYVHIQFACN